MRHILIFTLLIMSFKVSAQTVPTVWANTLIPVRSANKDSSGYATLSQLFSGYGSGLSWNVGGNTVTAHSVFGNNANYDLIFRTNSTERMRILANGDISLGSANSKIIYPNVANFTAPAQGTRKAFLNVSQYSSTRVTLTCSENGYHETSELLITRFWNQSPTEQPTIYKTIYNAPQHAHGHDIGYSADLSGNIYFEKVLYATARTLVISKIEQLYGTCTILDGSLTNTGISADNAILTDSYLYRSGSNVYFNNSFTNSVNLGINTGSNPTNTLDVNGTIRVRSLSSGSILDSILTASATGVLSRRTVSDVTGWVQNGNDQYSARSGNVGIGTATPLTKLHVNGSITIPNTFGLYNINQTSGVVLRTAGNMDFYNNNAIAVSITTNGNVGIGTTTPYSKLDIGANRLRGILRPNSTDLTSYYSETWGLANDGGGAQGFIYSSGSGGSFPFDNYGELIIQGTSRSGYNTGVSLVTGTGSSQAIALRATASGNVGIGTASPNALLEVSKSTTDATVNQEVLRVSTTGRSSTGGTDGRGTLIGFSDNANTTLVGAIGGMRQSPSGNYLGGTSLFYNATSGTPTTTVSGLIEGLTLRSDGNVGIGNTAPQAKLDVTGTVNTSYSYGYGLGITGALPNGVSGWYHTTGTTTGYSLLFSNLGDFRIKPEGATGIAILKNTGYTGIGTTTPNTPLEVNGIIRSSAFSLGGDTGRNRVQSYGTLSTTRFLNTGNGYSSVGMGSLVIGAAYPDSYAPPSSGLLVQGSAGIGVTSITNGSKLDVGGLTSMASMRLTSNSSSDIAGIVYTVPTVQNMSVGLKSNGNFVMNNGNVFVGTDIFTLTPSGKLTVPTFQLTTGATNNYVLQSDASGNASWVNPSSVLSNASGFIQNGNSFGATAAIGTNDNYDFRFKTNGSTKATLNQSGYFGIGVIAPDYKLDIWAGREGNPIRARGIQQSTSSADSALYVTSGGVFVRKEAPLRTAGALPTTAADDIGYQVLYVTATDTTQLRYIGGDKWRADFVKSATTPSVMVTSGSQTIDYTTATWRNTAVSVISGEIVDFSYQNGGWKSIAPMNIFTFGGKDGTDISAALTQAMLYTKKIYIPKGNYLAENVLLKSGIEIYGDGDSTVLQSKDTVSTKILYANSSDTNFVNNVKNIYIHDIKLLGRVAAAGFSEFKHLLSINGVTGVRIDNVTFEGFRGDGLYIGTGITGGEHRHNSDIVVKNCRFDGVNQDNRNSISVIDCNGIKIENCTFKNSSRVEMPGPIDFEVDYGYSSYKNIEIIGNRFENNRGYQLIGIYQPVGIIDTVRNVSIKDNYALNNAAHYEVHINSYLNITSATSTPFNIIVDNWVGKGGRRGFYIRNSNGVTVKNSNYENYAYDAVVGIATSNTFNTVLENNSFTRCGNTATVTGVEPFTEFYANFGALTIYTAKDVLIDKMDFIECGNGSTYRCGIYIVAGTTSYLNFSNLNLKGTYNYSVFRNGNNTNDAKSFRLKNVTDGYLHNVANYLSDDKGGVNNTFDDTNVLNDFPVGKSSTIINGVTIGGYTQGVLITEKYTNFSSYTNWGVQYFIPRSISGGNDTSSIFIRKSKNDASSWYEWSLVGSSNTPTYWVKATTNYTVLTSDRYISVENETANVTLTLPKAGDFPKRLLTIKRVKKAGGAVSSGTITLTPTTNTTSQAGNIENLDGTFGTSTTLTAQGLYGSTITLISNGAEWERINN